MKSLTTSIIFIFFAFIPAIGQKPLKQNQLYHRNYFSFNIDVGSGKGFPALYTGFWFDDGSGLVYFPSGGGFYRLSMSFTQGRRLTYSASYAYHLGGFNRSFTNGDGENARNIFSPTIRYSPFLFRNGKINIGVGANHIVSNNLIITAKILNEIQKVKYEFHKSTGPIALIEYQENFNEWLGARAGAGYSFMKYRLYSYSLNGTLMHYNAPPYEMRFHSANSIEFYFGVYFYI